MYKSNNKRNLCGSTQGFLLLFVLLFINATQAMAVSLTDVDFKSLPDGKTQIHMSFDGPAPNLSAYAVEDPMRLVLDLKQTQSKLGKKSYDVKHENVNSALAIAAGGRVRFVVDMKQLKPYASAVQGKNLYVTIGDGVAASTKSALLPEALRVATNPNNSAQRAKAAATRLADAGTSVSARAITGSDVAPSNSPTEIVFNSVKSVKFERTAIGSGEVHIKMANPSFQITAKRSGGSVLVEIPNASLSQSVPKVSNLSQFGTIIKSINNQASADKVIVKINAGADFDYETYQVDDAFVVSMTPKKATSITSSLTPNKNIRDNNDYSGERLSLNFQDIEVRSVLQLIADFTNLNLVVSDSVQGNITLRLKNVPWDQALEIVLKAKGLDKRREGNVLMIAPADEIAEREKKELEASQQLEALAPLMTEHIKIKYADATEIFNLFLQGGSSDTRSRNNSNSSSKATTDNKGTRGDDKATAESTASILSPRGSVIVDERTNSLFVTETAERLANLKSLINKIDIPIRQVMIEARIVLVSKNAARNIGVSWGAKITNGSISAGGALPGSLGSGANATNMVANFAVADAKTGINIGYLLGGGDLLNLQLQALEESGNGEVVSRPKVITGDKKEAIIESGSEVPFTTAGENGTITTEFKPVVLRLGVTPYITPDGRVIMDLNIIQDSVGELINVASASGGVSQIPRIDTTKLNTQVLAGDGETVVLGGVFAENNTVINKKTPLLGDLPIVGSFFRSKSTQIKKSETLIFITPRIIDEKLID